MLVVGGPESSRTLFGMKFLVNDATKYDDLGVFLSSLVDAREPWSHHHLDPSPVILSLM